MGNSSSPSSSSDYLESLMRAGQQSMKQFDDAITAAMGVGGSFATSQGTSPFAVYPDYVTQAWRLWNASIVNAFTAGTTASIQPSRGDKRFKDDACASSFSRNWRPGSPR
jgi:polyhydroxyalkanoate synthase